MMFHSTQLGPLWQHRVRQLRTNLNRICFDVSFSVALCQELERRRPGASNRYNRPKLTSNCNRVSPRESKADMNTDFQSSTNKIKRPVKFKLFVEYVVVYVSL